MKSLDVVRLEVLTAPDTWVNITGPAVTIGPVRRSGDVGGLSALVVGADLDPTVSSTLRFGKLVRVSAKQGSGWKPIYTGTLETLDVDYHPLDTHKVTVSLTATDNVSYLANAPERRGVATVDALRLLLGGSGVPFNVNGATTPGLGTVVATNDNGSLWSQILATRDSTLGYAWVDQENRLQVHDRTNMDDTVAATIGPDVYRDITPDFNSNQIINSVTVNFQRYDPVSGTTTEISYGPYEDAASIAEWDRYSATVTMQALTEDEVQIEAFANEILSRNATGEIRVKSMTIPVDSETRLPLTYLDLNAVVNVVLADEVTVKTLRIVGISHTITGDRWYLDLDFDIPGGINFPSTPPSTGVSVIPVGSVGTPQIKPGAVGTNEINFVARDIGGMTTTLSATSPTGAVVGDLWIDADDGNKLYRWTGSEWINVQDAAIAAAKARADLALSEAEQAIIDADAAALLAATKNKVTRSTSAPSGAGVTGDQWFRYTGTKLIGLWIHDGSTWQQQAVATALLAADAIDGMTVTGALIQTIATANRGVKMTSTGLVGYDSTGAVVFTLNATTGALSLKGDITSGSNISGANFTGGTYSGGTFTGGTGNFATMNGTVITGGLYQTATTGERLTIDSTTGAKSRITFYNGAPGTTSQQGYVEADSTGTIGTGFWSQHLALFGPRRGVAEQPRMVLGEQSDFTGSIAGFLADQIILEGDTEIAGSLVTEAVPHAAGYRTTAGSVASGGTWVNHGTPDSQTLRGGITYSAATGAYTVPVDGIYQVDAQVLFANHATGTRGLAITAGGVARYAYTTPGAANNVTTRLSFSVYLAAGSTIAPQVQQTSGTNLAYNTSSTGFTFVTITRIGS